MIVVRNSKLFSRLIIACLSLIAAISVYFFARIHPPEVLIPFAAASSSLVPHTNIFGSAPSFFYTLALGLLVGLCASSHSSARFHCITWIGLALFLEFTQHRFIAGFILDWINTSLPESIRVTIGPYWANGAFDALDLLATLMGGGVALYLLTHLKTENANVRE